MKDTIDNVSPFDLPQKSGKILTSAMNAGVIIGLVNILYFLVLNMTSFKFETMFLLVGILLQLLIVIYLCIKFKQLTPPNGYITFGQGFKFILFTYIVSGITYSIFYLLYTQFINTDYLVEYTDFTEQNLRKKGLDSEQIKASMEYTKKFSSPIFSFLSSFIFYSFLGTFFGLIIGAIIRKEPK